jgi:multimeric flavodoxin WrbA
MNRILMVCGSRNPQGQTATAAEAVLSGAAAAGAELTRVMLPGIRLESCRQCDENGWGLCAREGRCVIRDDFAATVGRIREADLVLFATPVYYGDLSESLKAFLDRLRRTCTFHGEHARIKGKPVAGVCVAGGGGGGAPSCCVSLERVLLSTGFSVVDLVPVRRQNLQAKLPQLRLVGEWLARLAATSGTAD